MKCISVIAILFVAFAIPAVAEEAGEEVKVEGQLVTAIQTKSIDEDSSKAEEYSEVPQGFYAKKLKASFEWQDSGRYLEFWGKNVRLNSARYGLDYGVEGKYTFAVDYTKIPHLYSKAGKSFWTETNPGEWRISDSIQTAIQNINPYTPGTPDYTAALIKQRAFVSSLIASSPDVRLDLQRNRGNVRFAYTPNTDWKYGFEYFRENRNGYRPIGTAFGFSWVTELPERIDYDTQRVHAGVEFNKNGRSFAASYDLSLFGNEVESMVWDNPYRITDRTYDAAYSAGDGAVFGRAAMPPDNTANTFSFAGATKLGKSRLSGSFSYGVWTDEVKLLPSTTNSSIAEIHLPASTFNGKMENITANVTFVSKFSPAASLTARYRLYDQKNKNDHLDFEEYVRFDQVLEDIPRENELWAYTSHNVDLDFNWTLSDALRLTAGYGFNRWDREHRNVKKADTNRFRTSLDATMSDWATVRFSWQYSRRRYDAYELKGTYLVIPLLRYDQANLNQNIVKIIAELAPNDAMTVGATAGFGKDEYPDTAFGLFEAQHKEVGVDWSYGFSEGGSVTLWFEHTELTSDQKGRQSGSTPSTDPRADWTANLVDKYDTIGAGLTLDLKKDVITWDTTTSFARANGDANLFSPAGGTPDVAKSLSNMDETDLITAKTGLYFKLFNHAKLGLGYWFEKYNIDDYAEATTKADLVTTGSVLLGAVQPDYTYHVGWLTLSYTW